MLDQESGLRFGVFALVLTIMALWETLAPWRSDPARRARWPGNIGLAVLGAALIRVTQPLAPLSAAIAAQANGWGLFHWFDVPSLAATILAVVLLDLVIYAQHRLFHVWPAAWPIHRVHHADTTMDVTTGLRFHPIEIVISLVVKTGAVFALGASPAAVMIFEIALNATAMFNHANVRLPHAIDNVLRWLIVTPAMHRVHHSVVRTETDSNFGFNIPWWDRLFGTYQATPTGGEDGVAIGLADFRGEAERGLVRLLTHPFRGSH